MLIALRCAPALAGDGALKGAEIEALLPTIRAHGTVKETRQTFWEGGRTEYEERGHYSYGRWWVQDDRYCSKWPPSDAVSCYRVLRDGDRLIWVPRSGDRIVDRIAPR